MCNLQIQIALPPPPVLPDVAGAIRLRLGALSPARGASEVRLDVQFTNPIRSAVAGTEMGLATVPLDVAGASRLHLGVFSPAPRALEVRLDVAGVSR